MEEPDSRRQWWSLRWGEVRCPGSARSCLTEGCLCGVCSTAESLPGVGRQEESKQVDKQRQQQEPELEYSCTVLLMDDSEYTCTIL